MDVIISIANSFIEPSSKPSIAHDTAHNNIPHFSSSSSSRSALRLQQPLTSAQDFPAPSRSSRELGVGLASILKSFLEYISPEMRAQQARSPNVFRLFCSEAPISIEDFGERLGTYFSCSPVCFVVATVYLGRVWETHPEVFEYLSIFKLMLVSLTVAVKFCEDRCSSQAHYAKCGGIEVDELNSLEALFLSSLLGFRAFVSQAEMQIAMLTLEKYCSATGAQCNSNGSLIAEVAASQCSASMDISADAPVKAPIRRPTHSSF